MRDYFRAVTLGAFTWKNEERIGLLMDHVRRMNGGWLLLHFLLITVCLNFPVAFAIAGLDPQEIYSRLQIVPEEGMEQINILMPLLGFAFGIMLLIQAFFFISIVFFLGISRLHSAPLSFRDRLGLSLFSSTLPVLAATLFGLYLPTVHIIIFYFIVMFFAFQRSKLCPNG